MKFTIGFSITLIIAVSACKNDVNKDSSISNNQRNNLEAATTQVEPNLFLTYSDFNSATFTNLSKADLEGSDENSVNEQLDLLNSSPGKGSAEEDHSFDSCLNATWALKDPKDLSTLVMSYKKDITSCINDSFNKSTTTNPQKFQYKNISYEFLGWIQCPGENLSTIAGKKLDEVEDFPCKAKMKTKFAAKFLGHGVFEGNPDLIYEFETSNGFFNQDGSACETIYDGEKSTYLDGCLELSHTRSSSLINGQKSNSDILIRNRYIGVSATKTSTQFKTGSFDIFYNGWTGSATFNGASPIWTLRNQGQIASGTYTGPSKTSSLKLQADSSSVQSSPFTFHSNLVKSLVLPKPAK
ncbi:MAG: hypothetical protein WCI18_11670 [Pseudomonadota bacterium]